MRVADARTASPSLAELDRRLAETGADGVPLLVFRLPALERTAWRAGLRAARSLERRAATAFAGASARVNRRDDLIAHEPGSDVFVAALAGPMRSGHRAFVPVDIRRALARIAAALKTSTALEVESGWTRYDSPGNGELEAAIAAALVRGSHERERYAFFCAVGHELRTPLASIRGYLETLAAGEIDAATSRRFIGVAYSESLRLGRLLEGMFEISLLDLSAAFPPRGRCSLDRVFADAAIACAPIAQTRGVRLSIGPVPALAVAMHADRLMLVLINLIDNATKHGRRCGHVAVNAVRPDARTVTIVVDDDGPGVALVDRERLFALGERGLTPAAGTGIGLALVRLIAERVGGRVEIGHAPLGGARFAVTIPQATDV